MKPGNKLDALIAEHVMGWTYLEKPHMKFPDEMLGYWDKHLDPCPDDVAPWQAAWTWHPSTSIASAWEVVEKMQSEGYLYFISNLPFNADEGVEITFSHPSRPDENGGCCKACEVAETAPHAICLAALKAVGVEI